MFDSINTATFSGNLTRDFEVKSTASGMTIATGSIAVSESRKDASGEYKKSTFFLKLTSFGKYAETIAKFARKGDSVVVTGKLKVDVVEKDGSKNTYNSLIVSGIHQVKKSGSNESSGQGNGGEKDFSSTQSDSSSNVNGYSDEDIPF